MESALKNYFSHLNSFSIEKYVENAVGKKEIVSSEDAVNSFIEWIARGEVLFDLAAKEAEARGQSVDNKLVLMYKILLDAKRQLVDVLKKDSGKGKYAYVWAPVEEEVK